MLEIHKIITLGNDSEYLVLNKVEYDNIEYYYIAEVNDAKTDIKDNYKIITTKEEEGNLYVEEIKGQERLKEILPLFLDKE